MAGRLPAYGRSGSRSLEALQIDCDLPQLDARQRDEGHGGAGFERLRIGRPCGKGPSGGFQKTCRDAPAAADVGQVRPGGANGGGAANGVAGSSGLCEKHGLSGPDLFRCGGPRLLPLARQPFAVGDVVLGNDSEAHMAVL